MRRRAAVLFLLVACSSPDVVGVDENDVLCDPLDGTADDSDVAATDSPTPLTQWVDPFVGTGGVGWGVGTTYPGAQAPFGMARPSPDTSSNGAAASFMHCSGYTTTDDTIDGFSQFHLHGAGIADYGGTALMPTIGMTAAKAATRGHGSHFSHATESASPGYYAVTLDDTDIRVELTATTHVAFHRYTFPANVDATVIVDAGHLVADDTKVTAGSVTIDPAAGTVSGSSHVVGQYSSAFGGMDLYFFARFSKAFTAYGTYLDGVLADGGTTQTGDDVGAYVHFDPSSGVVEAHVGVSFVDVAHAKQNLDAEDQTFDAARAATGAAWEARLERARVSTRGDHDRRIFYTALYHSALMPTVASDVDGSYRGIDGNVHHATFRYFTDFSLWDTYRTLHPLITLLYPEDAADLAQSLVQMGQDGGFLPRWPIGTGESGGMIGDGATIVLADTFVKGVTGWDDQTGYTLAKTQATTELPKGGRDAVADWVSLGYVPVDDSASSSVSKTLEYAAADAALASWATAEGHTGDAATFDGRAKAAWRALYDPDSHFLWAKTKAGELQPVTPTAMGGAYTEGSAWQYDFMVPFDVDGLQSTMTRPVLLGRLEQFFTRRACNGSATNAFPSPYYWASNEPDLFSGWIFGALGDTTRAGRWLRWATLANYDEGPGGLPGNDDSGTMSAFYIFASLGFYPIPGTDLYVLGSPLIPHATLSAPGGTITIDAPAASKLSRFPTAITLNGASVASEVHHRDLLGATLHFDMSR